MKKSTPAGEIKKPYYRLKLFVSTYATSSHRAINNLTAMLEERLADCYQLDVIDVRKEPAQAEQENITALPLLIKMAPSPYKRLVGDMSDHAKVMVGLNLPDH
jgi:circadian clock protein KaiB